MGKRKWPKFRGGSTIDIYITAPHPFSSKVFMFPWATVKLSPLRFPLLWCAFRIGTCHVRTYISVLLSVSLAAIFRVDGCLRSVQ